MRFSNLRPINPETAPGVSYKEEETPEAAFERFVSERYSRLVGAVSLIVRERHTAEDIVQETFARAYLNWSKLWPEGNPAGWAHRVAVNLALSWRRRATREARALLRLASTNAQSFSIPDVDLHRAVAGLPPRQKAAIAFFYILDLPVEEVAAAMGCRPGTVKSLLHSARGRLRKEMEAP